MSGVTETVKPGIVINIQKKKKNVAPHKEIQIILFSDKINHCLKNKCG